MNSGPVAQFMPKASGCVCRSDAHMASTVWPASIEPIGSMVTETTMESVAPISLRQFLMARVAALILRVSWQVSTQQEIRAAFDQAFRLHVIRIDQAFET